MSAVAPPPVSYKPKLPTEVVEGYIDDQGKHVGLSDVQLETVAAAGQVHQQLLPADNEGVEYRRGYMLGDGTGVGKGRQVAGVILDNKRQGRSRAVWVSMNQKLFGDAKRDWSGVGGDEGELSNLV